MVQKLEELTGKVVIVTGGGGGIGQAVVRSLVNAGARVVAADIRLEDAARIAQGEPHILPLKVDLSDYQSVQELAATTVQKFGQIDGLVNAGGVQGPIGPLAENDVQQWARTIQINLIGTFHCCKAVLPFMMERHCGKIINFSGGGATAPRPNYSAYAASKVAVVRLTETLADEVKDYNIQVNAIAPGAVNTRMLAETLAAGELAGDKASAEAQRQLASGGTPPELAAALILYLLSEASGTLSGRLISAPHDGWQTWDQARITEIMSAPWFTLRRMDAFTLHPLIEKLKAQEDQ